MLCQQSWTKWRRKAFQTVHHPKISGLPAKACLKKWHCMGLYGKFPMQLPWKEMWLKSNTSMCCPFWLACTTMVGVFNLTWTNFTQKGQAQWTDHGRQSFFQMKCTLGTSWVHLPRKCGQYILHLLNMEAFCRKKIYGLLFMLANLQQFSSCAVLLAKSSSLFWRACFKTQWPTLCMVSDSKKKMASV